jgi:hypothetical protein
LAEYLLSQQHQELEAGLLEVLGVEGKLSSPFEFA